MPSRVNATERPRALRWTLTLLPSCYKSLRSPSPKSTFQHPSLALPSWVPFAGFSPPLRVNPYLSLAAPTPTPALNLYLYPLLPLNHCPSCLGWVHSLSILFVILCVLVIFLSLALTLTLLSLSLALSLSLSLHLPPSLSDNWFNFVFVPLISCFLFSLFSISL